MTRYLFQRIAPNATGWLGPSGGRLKQKKKPNYVEQHGIGYEDWNFNSELTIDDWIYGYLRYRPASSESLYNIAFAEYKPKVGWFLAGFYINCEYIESGAPPSEYVTNINLRDIQRLRAKAQTNGIYADKDDEILAKRVQENQSVCRWRVRPHNIIQLSETHNFGSDVYNSDGKHYGTPTFMSEMEFLNLRRWSEKFILSTGALGEFSAFPEGKTQYIKHLRRERSSALVSEAKNRFIETHGRLFCEICDFNFKDFYGESRSISTDCIEAHHILPLHKLDNPVENTPKALRMLCPNCHRVVHRVPEWLNDFEGMRRAVRSRNRLL